MDQLTTFSSLINFSLPADRSNNGPAAHISSITLERFVFRRDDDANFPDEVAAPMRAKCFTSVGDPFTVVLLPAAPPAVSRLYVQWPRGPRGARGAGMGTELVTGHGGLLLLCLTYRVDLDKNGPDKNPYRQDYFICKFTHSAPWFWIKRLPACTEPIAIRTEEKETHMDRRFNRDTIALYCCNDVFVVVQLAKVHVPSADSQKMSAELCVFRPPLWSNDHGSGIVAMGKWEVLTLPIRHSKEKFPDLNCWSTDAAFTCQENVCWVDYHHGSILSYRLFLPEVIEPSMLYFQLPIDNRPHNSLPSKNCLKMYRSICVTGKGNNEILRFIDMARLDGGFLGSITPGSSFTITYHTFSDANYEWSKDAVITSEKLRHLYACNHISHNAVSMFPFVSVADPHHIQLLVSELRDRINKLSVAVIEMTRKEIVSVFPYIQGEEDLRGVDADMVRHRSRLPQPFLHFSY